MTRGLTQFLLNTDGSKTSPLKFSFTAGVVLPVLADILPTGSPLRGPSSPLSLLLDLGEKLCVSDMLD